MSNEYPKKNLTTLEEDFQFIGLIPATPVAAAPDGGGEPPKKEEEKKPEVDADPIAEGVKRIRTKKLRGAARAKSKQYARKRKSAIAKSRRIRDKRHKSSGQWKSHQRKLKSARAKMGTKTRTRLVVTGIDRLSNLMEEVKELVGGVNLKEAMKGYANMSLVADGLKNFFAASEREDVRECAEVMDSLSEDAADAATALKEAFEENDTSDIDDKKIEEHFKEMLAALTDGLDLFEAITKDKKPEEFKKADEKKKDGKKDDPKKPDFDPETDEGKDPPKKDGEGDPKATPEEGKGKK